MTVSQRRAGALDELSSGFNLGQVLFVEESKVDLTVAPLSWIMVCRDLAPIGGGSTMTLGSGARMPLTLKDPEPVHAHEHVLVDLATLSNHSLRLENHPWGRSMTAAYSLSWFGNGAAGDLELPRLGTRYSLTTEIDGQEGGCGFGIYTRMSSPSGEGVRRFGLRVSRGRSQ